MADLRDELWAYFLSLRDVQPGDECRDCSGLGVRGYASTATWRGGIGGQAITSDVCDKCWGSGSASHQWPSHRRPLAPSPASAQAPQTEGERCKECRAQQPGPHKPDCSKARRVRAMPVERASTAPGAPEPATSPLANTGRLRCWRCRRVWVTAEGTDPATITCPGCGATGAMALVPSPEPTPSSVEENWRCPCPCHYCDVPPAADSCGECCALPREDEEKKP